MDAFTYINRIVTKHHSSRSCLQTRMQTRRSRF
jgi:hypothetical protein